MALRRDAISTTSTLLSADSLCSCRMSRRTSSTSCSQEDSRAAEAAARYPNYYLEGPGMTSGGAACLLHIREVPSSTIGPALLPRRMQAGGMQADGPPADAWRVLGIPDHGTAPAGLRTAAANPPGCFPGPAGTDTGSAGMCCDAAGCSCLPRRRGSPPPPVDTAMKRCEYGGRTTGAAGHAWLHRIFWDGWMERSRALPPSGGSRTHIQGEEEARAHRGGCWHQRLGWRDAEDRRVHHHSSSLCVW